MKVLVICGMVALMLCVAPVYADDDDESLRFQPGFQLNVFVTGGGPDGPDGEGVAWGFGGQGTLFKWGQLSFIGPGMSFIHLAEGHRFAPYVELVTINLNDTRGSRGSRDKNIIGITFKYIAKNLFYLDGMPLDHGIGVGFVFVEF